MKHLSVRLASLLLVLLVSAAPLQANQRSDFSEAQLDAMLAPIALYPDTILSHILIASTYPLEIVQADRWARANPGLEGEAAVSAVEQEDWEPSVKALVAFPHILQRLSDDLAWTQQLGDAFLDNEAAVMDAIQRLRRHAYDAGSLDRMEHVRVQRDREVIVIEPAVERVVYVPVYDTRVVYGRWWWNDYPPVYWHYPSHYTFVHGFYWGPRIHVGSSFYFSSFHWQRRQVVCVDYRRYHHRPHFHTGRSIVHYQGATHWRHNPTHRRGVAYHNERVSRHYQSNRTNYSSVHQNRNNQARWQREQGQVYRDQSPRHEADRVRQQLGSGRSNQEERYWRNRDNQGTDRRGSVDRQEGARQSTELRQQLENYTGDKRPERAGPTSTTRPSPKDPRQLLRGGDDTKNREPRSDRTEATPQTRYFANGSETRTRNRETSQAEARYHKEHRAPSVQRSTDGGHRSQISGPRSTSERRGQLSNSRQ